MLVSSMSNSRDGHLVTVSYPNPQRHADEQAPIGWCNQCVGEAKQAELDSSTPVQVHAGVTLVVTMQKIPTPQGEMMYPAMLPTCWSHIGGVKKNSSLVQAPAGVVPPG
jgi:hypothetical protein